MSQRLRINVHDNGYYQVSIPNYQGGEVVDASLFDKLEKMLVTIIDANYGASPHHIGDGDGIPEREANEIRLWWETYLYNKQKGSPS